MRRAAPMMPVRPGTLILAAYLALCAASLDHENGTSDEGLFLYTGYRTLTEWNFAHSEDHPPLMRMLNALPLLLPPGVRMPAPARTPEPGGPAREGEPGVIWRRLDPPNRAACEMLYHAGNDPDRLILLGRLPSVACGALAIAGTWTLGRMIAGAGVGWLAAALLAASPVFLTYARLIKEEVGLTAALTWLLVALLRWRRRPTPARAGLAGVSVGAALLMKQSAAALLPVVTWMVLSRRRAPRARSAGALALAAWLTLLAGYGGTGLALPHEMDRDLLAAAFPNTSARATAGTILRWTPLPAEFIIAGLYQLGKLGPDSPEAGRDHFGRPNIVAYGLGMAAKSPEGFLVLLGLSLAGWSRRTWIRFRLPVAAGAVFAGAVMLAARTAQYDLYGGVRYLLPVWPPMCLVAASFLCARHRRTARGIAWLAVTAHLAAGAGAARHPLPYANLLFGGTAGAHRWLTGTDVDWGQELKSLARYVRSTGASDLILSYAGTASPEAYGLRYQDMDTADLARLRHVPWLGGDEPRRELLAVSAPALMLTQPGRQPFPWTAPYEPEAVLGGTLFVYDITRNKDLHTRMAKYYLAAGRPEELKRESRRIRVIAPADAAAHEALANLCDQLGFPALAREERAVAGLARRSLSSAEAR